MLPSLNQVSPKILKWQKERSETANSLGEGGMLCWGTGTLRQPKPLFCTGHTLRRRVRRQPKHMPVSMDLFGVTLGSSL